LRSSDLVSATACAVTISRTGAAPGAGSKDKADTLLALAWDASGITRAGPFP
jgi:hypothetical protein